LLHIFKTEPISGTLSAKLKRGISPHSLETFMDRILNPTTPPSPSLAVGTMIALILLVVGGLNWALVGLFNFDLVAALFGSMTVPTRVIYVVVGLAAVYALTLLPRLSRLS
jgi:uncharacterized protein